jgi:hypothetical protein
MHHKMKLFPFLLAALSTLVSTAAALGQNATVTLSPGAGLLHLAGNGTTGQILVSEDEWWGVLRVAEDLGGDFGKVTGRNLTLGNWKGMNGTAGETAVYYEFQPVTGFINVSPQLRGRGFGGRE